MKKTLLTIALMALMLLATSGLHSRSPKIETGDLAPEIALDNGQRSLSLSQLRGDYVLLTFWSSANAPSRIQNNQYSAWVDAHENPNLKHISVNFDQQPLLFDAIAQRDHLNPDAQFNVTGKDAEKITNDYGLADQGYGSVLIGPDGRIVAFDPSTSDLNRL